MQIIFMGYSNVIFSPFQNGVTFHPTSNKEHTIDHAVTPPKSGLFYIYIYITARLDVVIPLIPQLFTNDYNV